jgi:hypothetical protein
VRRGRAREDGDARHGRVADLELLRLPDQAQVRRVELDVEAPARLQHGDALERGDRLVAARAGAARADRVGEREQGVEQHLGRAHGGCRRRGLGVAVLVGGGGGGGGGALLVLLRRRRGPRLVARRDDKDGLDQHVLTVARGRVVDVELERDLVLGRLRLRDVGERELERDLAGRGGARGPRGGVGEEGQRAAAQLDVAPVAAGGGHLALGERDAQDA